MDVEFSSKRLGEASVNLSEASRLFGIPVGRKYIQRVSILRATDQFSVLFGHRALRLHALKGNRAGQYSITLSGNFRLILQKLKEDTVCIIDVEDYHGH